MNKNKKIIIVFLIVLFIVIGVVCLYKVTEKSVTDRANFNFTAQNVSPIPVDTVNNEKNNNQSEVHDTMENVTNISVSINGKKYIAIIENNETTKTFINRLPQEFNMNELNGNEKYIYMDSPLPTNLVNPKHIKSGDIMLYGSDCLVIFYKSFDTNYSYTKIGHIDNLPDLGNDNIIAKFERYAPPMDMENKDSNANKITDVKFVRTYNIVANLNMTDTTGKYNFYVVQQFQLSEPIVIKIDNEYNLEENKNYEFTFKGTKIDGKEYTIQDIFNTFDITNIEKTDRIGLEQRQDEI